MPRRRGELALRLAWRQKYIRRPRQLLRHDTGFILSPQPRNNLGQLERGRPFMTSAKFQDFFGIPPCPGWKTVLYYKIHTTSLTPRFSTTTLGADVINGGPQTSGTLFVRPVLDLTLEALQSPPSSSSSSATYPSKFRV